MQAAVLSHDDQLVPSSRVTSAKVASMLFAPEDSWVVCKRLADSGRRLGI